MTTQVSAIYARRRHEFLDRMVAACPSSVAILPAAPVQLRNGDVDHDYRQDSDFYYLTGFDEPQSVAVLDGAARKFTLFVRERDREREGWDGPRAGVEGAKALYGADEALPIGELDERMPGLLQNRTRVVYALGVVRRFDDRVLRAIDRVRSRHRTGVAAPSEITAPGAIVHEMRLRKSGAEVETMRAAAEVTAEAHALAMARARPGMNECAVEALLLETFRRRGSERPAYGSIVGSGPNACILHYRKNDRVMAAGDLLLIDAGCELGYYASDVTRTFPVGRDFSREQQALYEVVLEAQLEGIAAARAGNTVEGIHRETATAITRGLLRLGLLEGELEKLVESEGYKRFFMHRTSHWLGMDVHDVGSYFVGGEPRRLEAGMVLTVEPGVYVAPDDTTVGPSWRGIGIRIEDDVLVTDGAPDVLTAAIPKTVSELRQARAG